MSPAVAAAPPAEELVLVPTRLFGPLQVKAGACFTFPDGLLGFAGHHRFVLLPAAPEGLYWLQSTEDSGLVFLLGDPLRFAPHYAPDLGDAGAADEADAGLLAIITLPRQPGLAPTMNLQGPIVVDFAARCGRQVVLGGGPWPVQQPVDLAPVMGRGGAG